MTNKIGVRPKYRHNRVGAVGEEGVEDQEEKATSAGPPGEPSISSDPQENAPLKVARDPGATTKEREDHNATHIPFRSWCPIFASKRKEGKRRTEMQEEKRGVVRPQFQSITKLLDKRKIVMTRRQPLCTKTITPK